MSSSSRSSFPSFASSRDNLLTTEMVSSGMRHPLQYPLIPSSRKTSAARAGMEGEAPLAACNLDLRLSSWEKENEVNGSQNRRDGGNSLGSRGRSTRGKRSLQIGASCELERK